jgi:hypothetical protein
MEQEVRSKTLIFINESKVEESIIPANNSIKKFVSILHLRSVNEASPSFFFATGV